MAQGSQQNDGLISGINVTPLVDIVLVLLVILMTTASYAVSKAIPVVLPSASTGEQSKSVLVVSIDRNGKVHLGSTAVMGDQELRRAVRDARKKGAEREIALSADGAAPHRAVVRVMDLLRNEGVSRFAIQVTPAASDGS